MDQKMFKFPSGFHNASTYIGFVMFATRLFIAHVHEISFLSCSIVIVSSIFKSSFCCNFKDEL